MTKFCNYVTRFFFFHRALESYPFINSTANRSYLNANLASGIVLGIGARQMSKTVLGLQELRLEQERHIQMHGYNTIWVLSVTDVELSDIYQFFSACLKTLLRLYHLLLWHYFFSTVKPIRGPNGDCKFPCPTPRLPAQSKRYLDSAWVNRGTHSPLHEDSYRDAHVDQAHQPECLLWNFLTGIRRKELFPLVLSRYGCKDGEVSICNFCPM